MTQFVFLILGLGNLNDGFPNVQAEIWEDGRRVKRESGSLPPAPELQDLYRSWLFLYELYYQHQELSDRLNDFRFRGSDVDEDYEENEADFTNFSEQELSELCQRYQDSINNWLASHGFRKIERFLWKNLSKDEDILIFIESEDNKIQRLPWRLWELFENYYAELALSLKTPFETVEKRIKKVIKKVKILSIIGDCTGLDEQEDKNSIEKLPDVLPKFLKEPKCQDIDAQLWREGWDIFFYTGHSSSQSQGTIKLNQQESLSIEDLKHGLQEAIRNGLKLAIFNSCDGLGLAEALAELNIPYVIVMREPVPDRVAREFLRYFLEAFSGGKYLYAAIREARLRLNPLEKNFPCATWLPVICQNPGVRKNLTWQELRDGELKSLWHQLMMVLVASLILTSLVMGLRSLGFLQTSELQAYDQLMRLRSAEQPDNRLAIVTVTEKDIQWVGKYPLTDQVMLQTLKKLEKYQPRVIGLDIIRDLPQEPGHAEFLKHIQQSDRFIAVCEVAGSKGNPGIAAPKAIPLKRQGFSDLLKDNDGIVRRNLLAMAPGSSRCQTDKSFSLQIARQYLAQDLIFLDKTEEDYFKLDRIIFKTLDKNSGSYHKVDNRGHQVMLNYRSGSQVAPEITLTDVLMDKVDPNLIKNRIVLIGTTAKSVGDDFYTPYSAGRSPIQELSGVMIHAHQVSQIISAVLERRPLLSVWSEWAETLWIFVWSIVGGLIALLLRSRIIFLGLAVAISLALLHGFSFSLLLQGWWVPLVPAALVLVATSAVVVLYRST